RHLDDHNTGEVSRVAGELQDFSALVPYLDSCTPAFTNSVGHSCTRRVDHSHEADEAQVLSGEVHIVSVKSKALWELVIRQVELTET
uniref:Uncharacterized protein n=1 Tax=Amphilophus citrinellus TaxID=61819 RepID=A0A3Q0QYF4_AMPCI